MSVTNIEKETGMPVTPETINLSILYEQKVQNLYEFIFESIDLQGEALEKFETLKKNEVDFANIIKSELLISIPMIIELMLRKYGWTWKKILEERELPDGCFHLRNDFFNLLNEVSTEKNLPPAENSFTYKPEINERQFLQKMMRYYQFFANIILVLVPETLKKIPKKEEEEKQ